MSNPHLLVPLLFAPCYCDRLALSSPRCFVNSEGDTWSGRVGCDVPACLPTVLLRTGFGWTGWPWWKAVLKNTRMEAEQSLKHSCLEKKKDVGGCDFDFKGNRLLPLCTTSQFHAYYIIEIQLVLILLESQEILCFHLVNVQTGCFLYVSICFLSVSCEIGTWVKLQSQV